MVRSTKNYTAALNSVAGSVAAELNQPRGVVIEWLLPLISAFLPMLAKLLPCLNPATVPVDPTPNPTPAAVMARKNAWALKGRAEKAWNGTAYDQNTVRQMAHKIRAQKRKRRAPIKQDEAETLAVKALDAARQLSLDTIQATILEAQQAA
jgi:hypothetical protein